MIIGVRKQLAADCWAQAFGLPLSVFLLVSLATLTRAAEIGCLYPAGGQPGTTFEVSVLGQGLKSATGAHISGSGVEAALVNVVARDSAKPDKLRAPHLQEEAVFRVTLAKDIPPGPRDFRLICGTRLSLPHVFTVGRYSELSETEPNNTALNGMKLDTLPVCINGRITDADTDTFRFRAVQGQTLVAQVQGRALAPYLADLVPGWFQPLLTLVDAQGRELMSANGFRLDSDPLLVCHVPATGEYALQLRDVKGRGRDDFVYRLTLGELPLVTGFFPQGGKKGNSLNIALEGVNLPPQKVRIFSGNKTSEACLQTLVEDKLCAPGLRFDLDNLPETVEIEPDAESALAQNVPLPIIVNGTVDATNDVDIFRFEGQAGQKLTIESCARQLGSPLDTVITLADSHGRIIATHDDPSHVFTGLLTTPCDAALTTRLPVDDTYEVRLRDTLGKGGSDYHYRLRLSEPRPDFELWVTPSTLSIPLGGKAQANVHVRRLDGFTGPISVQLDNPPLGIACEGGYIPSNATENVISLSCWPSTKRLPQGPFELNLSGLATNGATLLRRSAAPAHRNLSAPDYEHLVQDQAWLAVVDTEPPAANLWRLALPQGTACVRASAKKPFDITITSGKAKALASYVSIRVAEPKNGFVVSKVRDGTQPGELVVTLTCEDGGHAPPPVGNLVLSVARKSTKSKWTPRVNYSALTTATPYVIE